MIITSSPQSARWQRLLLTASLLLSTLLVDAKPDTDNDSPTDSQINTAISIPLSKPISNLLNTPPSTSPYNSTDKTADPAPTLQPATLLKPYTAIYGGKFSGISAEMERSLKRIDGQGWQLRNYSELLFISIEEKSQFEAYAEGIIPAHYQYKNSLNSKRNSKLSFNWQQSTASDQLHNQAPLPLPADALDKLSFQTQLRLDLASKGRDFTSKTYHLVDKNKLKTYQVSYLGEEVIDIAAGKFNAIKLQQRRPGKERHTLIWLATDWDYLLLKIQRIEAGKSDYAIVLKEASIAGEAVQGLK